MNIPRSSLLRHLTTANMARDLDRIRAALGEPTASFYGASDGSALGAAYVSLFPDSASATTACYAPCSGPASIWAWSVHGVALGMLVRSSAGAIVHEVEDFKQVTAEPVEGCSRRSCRRRGRR